MPPRIANSRCFSPISSPSEGMGRNRFVHRPRFPLIREVPRHTAIEITVLKEEYSGARSEAVHLHKIRAIAEVGFREMRRFLLDRLSGGCWPPHSLSLFCRHDEERAA